MTMGLYLTQNSTCLHHLFKATQQGILGVTFMYKDLRHNTPTHSRDIHRPNISSPCMSTISNHFIWSVYFFDSNHYSTLAYHNSVLTLSNMRDDILTATIMSKAKNIIEATELSTMPKIDILLACDFLRDTVPRTSPTPIMRVVIHTMIPVYSHD